MTAQDQVSGLVRVVIDVDADGHIAVTLDGEPWEPGAAKPKEHEVRLGRSDVAWVLEQLLGERVRPLHVTVHDDGRTYTDLLVPESSAIEHPNHATPESVTHLSRSCLTDDAAEVPPPVPTERRPGPGIDGGGFEPNEPVAIAVVVAQTAADEVGEVVFRVPEALRSKTGLLIMYGQESGVTLHFGPELDARDTASEAQPVSVVRDPHRQAVFGHGVGPAAP